MKKDLNVLVIAPFYDIFPFVGDLIDATAKYVSSIDVLIHHNYLAELAPYIPFSYFRWVEKFTKKNIAGLRSKPSNVKVHVLSTLYLMPDGRNRGLGDKLYKKFSEYIKKQGLTFDIIHAHVHWPQGYVAVKLGKEFNVPVVVTVHANRTKLEESIEWNRKDILFVFKNADALIRVNKADIEFLKNLGAKRVYGIPNGFNPAKFPFLPKDFARKELGLPLDKKIILNVAVLKPWKGHKYLIEAVDVLREKIPDILCYIGSNGPLYDYLRRLIEKKGLEENVKLLGYIPDEKLPLWMNAADLFVLPSLNEGNPTVMFEALGVGLPFVGTTVGGVPEVITSEDYGLLCKPGDPQDLAEKILIALERNWDRDKIRKYAEQFTWENIAKRVVNVYEEVLEETRKT
ncbi:glycosyltransferase [Thermococcus alcaliphilus]|uniref:glycosyltransferase n=1 Tax=Thermococcus alcaliphilus TaxID=139207 RepID=UPI0020909C96|nr:glycosyltransferase [Thermococcus alcaliphilus]MCO6042253.1 glycosyltransferase [Thermococcus alcaliphilus]